MDDRNKEYIKLKLAATLRLLLKKKKQIAISNKAKNIEDIRLVESIRQLEAESGLSYNILQTTFAGKRDIQFSTLINIVESLGYTFNEFAKVYEKITALQIEQTKKDILGKVKNPK